MMGAAFLFNRHLGEKTQKTELEDEAEDVLDDLHDGSRFFVQQASGKKKKKQTELEDEAEDILDGLHDGSFSVQQAPDKK